jgi:hypothetical protein
VSVDSTSAIAAMPVMKMHRQRRRFLASRNRFDIIAAGRRSGKTVEAKHRLLFGSFHLGGNHHGCLTPPIGVPDPTFVYAAPTHQQAKRIVWEPLKAAIPRWAIQKKSENDMMIRFVTGSTLYVAGMDQPQRIEGIPIDGVVPDEFADMKPAAWDSSIRPALSTPGRPPGWAMFIGRPRGKNHFWRLLEKARGLPDWGVYYPWPSWLVMAPEEIEAARRDLDERSFRQEYGGEFLSDAGRAYYQYGPWNNRTCTYDPSRDLLFAFDFNVSPGVAVVAQDLDMVVDVLSCYRCGRPRPGKSGETCGICGGRLPFETVTQVIGEVWIENDSNTVRVCTKLIEDWGFHRGRVVCYGDATGGARKTSSLRSDWQTIEDYLGRQWPSLQIDLPSVNPGQRDRVVVMNSRLRNSMDVARIYVDKVKARHVHEDLDETQLDDNGELDEGPKKMRTHGSDALGYLEFQRHGSPVQSASRGLTVESM